MNIHAIYAFCRNQWKLNVTIILWQKGVMSVVWGFQPEIQINRPIEDYLQSSLSHLAWMHEIFRLYVFWVFTEGIQYRTHEQWISNLINYEYTCDLRILQKSIKVECHDYLMAERCMSVVWRFQPEIQKNQTNWGLTSGQFVTLLKHETLMTFFTCIEWLSPINVNYWFLRRIWSYYI